MTAIPCPRWVKTAETNAFETEDFKYPISIKEGDLSTIPKHVAETYVECGGEIPYDDESIGSCSDCKEDTWSADEYLTMSEYIFDNDYRNSEL